MPTAPMVLIDLMTDEGLTGRSYVRCYTPVALDPLAALVMNLRSLIEGEAAEHAGIEPIRIEDGHTLIPDRPGAGLEWDEDAVGRLLRS